MTNDRHELTPAEQALFQSFHRRLAEAQAAIQNQFLGALLAVVAAHGLPDIPGGYRLSDDGTAIVPAQQTTESSPPAPSSTNSPATI